MDRPVWSETFEFPAFSDRLDSILMVRHMDQNEWSKDKCNGSCPINLVDLSIGDSTEKWYSLTDAIHPDSEAEVKLGMLLRYKPAEKDHDSLLRFRVVEAKKLPALDYGGTSDPYITITYEGKKRKTSTIFKTLNPVWNETIEFSTLAVEMDNRVVVECMDYDLAGSDDSCGVCEVDIHGLTVNQTVSQWVKLRDVKHPQWDGEVFLEYTLLPKGGDVEPDCSLGVRIIEVHIFPPERAAPCPTCS